MASLIGWFEQHDKLSGWAQFVGAIIAVAIAIAVPSLQSRSARRQARFDAAPAARASVAITKIPASFVVAEGALESGWGTSQLSLQAFNLFGVKADSSWHGPTIDFETGEYVNGERVTIEAVWRKYGSWLEAIEDHASFVLNNQRYKPAFAYTSGSTFAIAIAIAAAGYATDPQYGQKLVSIIKTHNLSALDVG